MHHYAARMASRTVMSVNWIVVRTIIMIHVCKLLIMGHVNIERVSTVRTINGDEKEFGVCLKSYH